MTNKHNMTVPFLIEDAEIQMDVTYTFTKGSPAVMYQRNGDPGWPADPDEFEVLEISVGGAVVPLWFYNALSASDFLHDWLHSHHSEPERCDL